MSELTKKFGRGIDRVQAMVARLIPGPVNSTSSLRDIGRGAGMALAITATMTFVVGVGILLSQRIQDPNSILLIGLVLTLSSFGSLVDMNLATFGWDGTAFASQSSSATIGIHSGTIAAITIAAIFLYNRRLARLSMKDLTSSRTSPLHFAIGFILMVTGMSFIAQFNNITMDGQATVTGISLLSLVFVFGLVWLASLAGSSADSSNAKVTEVIWLWTIRSLRNFAFIYVSLLVIILYLYLLTAGMDPKFGVASYPQGISFNMTPEQILAALAVIVLFGLNIIAFIFFYAIGINIGFDLGGNQLGALISTFTSQFDFQSFQWIYTTMGPLVYVGVLALVTLVALIAGAAASNKVRARITGIINFWKSLFVALFLSLSLLYFSGIQSWVEYGAEEAQDSAFFLLGASIITTVSVTTVILFLAFKAGGTKFAFMSSAFPRLVLGKRGSMLGDQRISSARTFGVFVTAFGIILAGLPLSIATYNRFSPYVDGPFQVGSAVSQNLTTASIGDLKKYLNPNSLKDYRWLDGKILSKAQPVEGFSTDIKVQNSLAQAWVPGNLDATIFVTLRNGMNSIVQVVPTTSEYKANGLIKHANYSPILSPSTLDLSVSKFLSGNKKLSYTVNGQKVKAGTYYAIPGVYHVKADGYKLVAPTDRAYFIGGGTNLIDVGYSVKLPKGADKILKSGIESKAKDCMKLDKSGLADCFNLKEDNLISFDPYAAYVPESYFDYSDSNYKTESVVCEHAGREDALVTSSVAISVVTCTAKISLTRTFYKSTTKKVPNYQQRAACVGAYVDPFGSTVYYDEWEGYWISEEGDWWEDDYIEWDPCHSEKTETYQDGYTTKEIRGEKISSHKVSTEVSELISVTGTLLENGTFKVTP